MFAAIGRFAFDRRRWVIGAAAAFFVVSLLGSRDIVDHLKAGGLEDTGSEAARAQDLIVEKLNQPGEPDLILLVGVEEGTLKDYPLYLDWYTFISRLGSSRATERVKSYFDVAMVPNPFITADETRSFATAAIVGSETEARARYENELRDMLRSDKFTVLHGGAVPANLELAKTIESDLLRAELLSIPLTFVLLFYVFRGFVASTLPLIAGVIAINGALALLRIVSVYMDISLLATAMVSMLALGVTIDYSLFIVSRYREEMARTGDDVRESVANTVATAGRAVAFSGLTTALSLMSLLFFDQMLLRSLAIGGAIAVLVAETTAILLLPALISTLGANTGVGQTPLRFGPSRLLQHLGARFNGFSRETGSLPDSGFWHRLSLIGRRRPLLIATAVTAVLLLAGLPFARIELQLPGDQVLPASFESRVVSNAVREDFSNFDASPVHVVIEFDDGLATDHYDEIAAYSDRLEGVEGVDAVQSITTLIDKQALRDLEHATGELTDPQTLDIALEGIGLFMQAKTALINVELVAAAQSGEGLATLDLLRDISRPPNTTVLFGGQSALLADTEASMLSKLPLVGGYIFVVTFVALFLQFGSVVLPVKAILMNAVSLSASFGVLVLIFQDGHLQSLLRFEEAGFITTVVPVLIFAIAFGLSIDYEIFLLSRVKEEYDATGDTGLAVARGLQRTGRIITGAALVIVVVVGAFATSEIVIMKQLGLGLALAVFIDATIIRALLVPAVMQLMGDSNWWAPAPLQRLVARVGLSEL
ncbi:MAG: MMPL family transporter [Dehalococcoidia bacterium]